MFARNLPVAFCAWFLFCSALSAGVLNSSNLVSQSLDPAPGIAGAELDDDSSTFEQGLIDGSCNLYFVVEMNNGVGPIVAGRDLALYVGTNPGNLTLQATDADLMPTLTQRMVPGIAGAVFGRTSPTSGTKFNGIPTSTYATTGGTAFIYGASFEDDGMGTSGVIDATNDSALFVGDHSSGYAVTAFRRGNAAPGTVGAMFNEDFRGSGTQRMGYNAAGNIAFLTNSLSGGDVSGSTNNEAVYGGSPFAPVMLARKGDAIGVAGHTVGDLSFNAKINANSDVLFDAKLAGGDVTGTTNDDALFINTGAGNVMIQREGSVAPGTGGATYSGSANLSSNSFTTAGVLFASSLSGTSGTTNDQALFLTSTFGTTSKIVQEGDATGLVGDVNFGVFNNSSISLTNSGRTFFHNTMVGANVTTADDSSRWTMAAGGTPELIAREGDLIPGSTDIFFGSLPTGNAPVNGLDQALLNLALTGNVTSADDSALYLWDAGAGLTQILREGETIVTPQGPRDVQSWSINASDNGDGSAVSFNDSGFAAIEVSFTSASGGGQGLFRVMVPEPATGSMWMLILGIGGILRRRSM